MSTLKHLGNNKIQLCCGGANCPIVEKIDDKTVRITDDFGSSVVMSADQASVISDATKTLSGKNDNLLLG